MPALSLADDLGPHLEADRSLAVAERAPRPGEDAGLDASVVQGLADARHGMLSTLYGTEWEAAGQRLDQAYATDGTEAYARLERDPETFGPLSGDRDSSGHVADTLWVREQVLAEARGDVLPASFRDAVAPEQDLERGPGWRTPEDARIAMETRTSLMDRRTGLVDDIARHSGDRREREERMLELVDRSIETIDLMGAHQGLAFGFDVAQVGSGRGTTEVAGRTQDGRPIILMTIDGLRNSDVEGNRVHELYHGGEFARNRITVGRDLQARPATSDFFRGDEEVAAFRTQYAFKPRTLLRSDYDRMSGMPGSDRAPNGLSDINRSYVQGLRTRAGQPAYPDLAGDRHWKP